METFDVVVLGAGPVGMPTSDLTGATAFLTSQDASFIAGQTLVVDGG